MLEEYTSSNLQVSEKHCNHLEEILAFLARDDAPKIMQSSYKVAGFNVKVMPSKIVIVSHSMMMALLRGKSKRLKYERKDKDIIIIN